MYATDDRLRDILVKLEEGVTAVFDGDEFKKYLDFVSRFHDYSVNNVILIAMQCPHASLVAGYGDWQKKHHRHVKKGEKGIKIIAPVVVKKKKKQDADGTASDPDDDQEQDAVCAFKVAHVFDVSQTEGEPIPTYGADELTGDIDEYNEVMDALFQVSPVPIKLDDVPGDAHGFFDPSKQEIVVCWCMPELQTVKTTIHEIAHAILHAWPEDGTQPKGEPDRHTKEVQAEAVAYTVCQHYGLNTSDYSFAYIAGWSTGRDVKELRNSLDVIRKTSHDLITAIDAARAAQKAAYSKEVSV